MVSILPGVEAVRVSGLSDVRRPVGLSCPGDVRWRRLSLCNVLAAFLRLNSVFCRVFG